MPQNIHFIVCLQSIEMQMGAGSRKGPGSVRGTYRYISGRFHVQFDRILHFLTYIQLKTACIATHVPWSPLGILLTVRDLIYKLVSRHFVQREISSAVAGGFP